MEKKKKKKKKKTGLILICLGDEKPGRCQTAAALKLTVDQTSWLLAPLVLLHADHVCALLKSGGFSVCVFVRACLSARLLFARVFPRAPALLPLCSLEHHQSLPPAALLNYTPALLKRHPQIRSPRLPRSTLLFPCGIYQRERITRERTDQVSAAHYSLNKKKKPVRLRGLVFFTAA